jgi:hypothetical protein
MSSLVDEILAFAQTLEIFNFDLPDSFSLCKLEEESWAELLKIVLYLSLHSEHKDKMIDHIRLLEFSEQTKIMEIINELENRNYSERNSPCLEEKFHAICHKHQMTLEENDHLRIEIESFKAVMAQIDSEKENLGMNLNILDWEYFMKKNWLILFGFQKRISFIQPNSLLILKYTDVTGTIINLKKLFLKL